MQDFKVIFIGDSGVGKTSLILRGTNGVFDSENNSTIGFSFQRMKKQGLNLMIWDTAGQEMYRSMIKMYYRGVHVAVIVYDVTCRDSFHSVSRWMQDIQEKQTNSLRKCMYFVVGNKSDKAERAVSELDPQ